MEGSQEQEKYARRKVSTTEVEHQAVVWREGLEEAPRKRVREVIEVILHEEAQEALGASARAEVRGSEPFCPLGLVGQLRRARTRVAECTVAGAGAVHRSCSQPCWGVPVG